MILTMVMMMRILRQHLRIVRRFGKGSVRVRAPMWLVYVMVYHTLFLVRIPSLVICLFCLVVPPSLRIPTGGYFFLRSPVP